jgi:hypothetical protein
MLKYPVEHWLIARFAEARNVRAAGADTKCGREDIRFPPPAVGRVLGRFGSEEA